MAKAVYTLRLAENQEHLRISDLFRDPRLAAIFRRGEEGDGLLMPAPVKPLAPVDSFAEVEA